MCKQQEKKNKTKTSIPNEFTILNKTNDEVPTNFYRCRNKVFW